MKLTLRPFALTVLTLSALAPSLRAQGTEKPRTYVVLAGVGKFADAAIPARPTAENDATALYDLVRDPKYLGAEASDVQLFLSSDDKVRHSEAATREHVQKALAAVAEKAGKDDLVIVGLFGRGAALGDRTCFYCGDSTAKDRATNALTAGDIEAAIKPLKSEKVVVLIDVDYKAPAPGQDAALEPNNLDLAQVFGGSEDEDEHTLPPGRIVFIAATNVARHLDDGTHGIFARAVLDGLHGKADTEGYEADGLVTVDELKKYLDAAVIVQARKLGKNDDEKEQTPFIWGTRSHHFALTRNPAVADKNDARIAELSKFGLDEALVGEGTRLIRRMPKLKMRQDVRRQYIALADKQIDVATFTEARAKLVAAAQLDHDDAEAFARRTITGLDMVKRVYIKELDTGELGAWAVKGMYRILDEALPEDLKARLEKPREIDREALFALLVDVRERLRKREDLEKNKDVDLAMKAAMFNLDPHSMYIDHEQIAEMQSKLMGQFTGIGIHVRRDMVRDGLLVISPIKDSPAYRAGIKAGDLITEIIRDVDAKGEAIKPPEVSTTKGMKSDDAVKKIMGLPRTKIRIRVVRSGADKPLEFELARAQIDVETVLGVKRKEDDSWDFMLDPASKIACIRLTEFAPRSFEDIDDAVKHLVKQGVRGLVLDLRFNPGGLLTGAVQIADLFTDDGLIVTVKPRSGVDDEVAYGGKTKRPETNFTSFPMVCLINGQSASASEIVSACLQDQQRATVMGERSYGKGSVQTFIDFPLTGAKIKLTTASFWRPNGKNLNKASTSGKPEDEWGVTPDAGHEIPLSRAEREALYDQLHDQEVIPNRDLKAKDAKPPIEDKQLKAAVKLLKQQLGE